MEKNALMFCVVAIYLLSSVYCKTVTHRDGKHSKFVDSMKDVHMKDGEHNTDFDHDVMWGNEEEDVTALPPEEQQKKLRSLVEKKIDANGDGFVSYFELVDWTRKSLDLFETEDTRSMFPEIDSNKDGLIQWQEYAADAYGEDFVENTVDFNNPPSDEWKEFVESYKKEDEKFKIADMDNNGGLTMEEFLIFKHPRLHEKTRQIVIDEALETADINGDGAIDMDEFIGDYMKTADDDDPEWTVIEREKFTNDLDTNKDGLLTGEEIVHWMAPDNSIMAKEEAEHLIDESDADGDKRLSIDEIVNNYAEWVDSDATDYGQQLLANHEEL